jgi:hypothetical protein
MSDTPTTPTSDYGEPWKVGRIDRPMEDRHGHDPLMLHRTAARAVACVNACAGMADPAAEIAALKQVGIANSVMHLEAVDAAAENAILRDQLDRICTDGFGNQDTIGGEPADDYVLRQLAAMREVIREAHRVLRDILKNYECGHLIDSQCETALAKLQRFITP